VQCPNQGACVLDADQDCQGACTAGQYLCPTLPGVSGKTCVDGVQDYAKGCPGLGGTHLDATLPEAARLDFLVAHTTMEQQIQQLQNGAPGIHGVGVPAYQWLNDDQHGVARTTANATVFPNGVGLGATFDAGLLRQVGFVVGNEARGLHNGFLAADPTTREMQCNGCGITAYAPNLNLVRDPRWGRAQEVYTEDPVLMSELVTAFVTGLQNVTETDDASAARRLQAGACCKHWAVYDIEGGAGTDDRYHFNADVDGRNFWESYVVGFDACVNRAKAMHVMCSYNSVNGVPTCANKGLLSTILRDQWQYEGFVVSDYDAWANIYDTHKYSADMEGAAADGLNAGMDQEGGGTKAIDQLGQAVKDGKTSAKAIETAFRRLMRARIRLGMFDPPADVSYNDIVYDATELATNDAHNAINRQASEESMTLLKNDDDALPLSADSVRTLGLVGFQSNNAGILSGNYAGSANTGNWGKTITQTLTGKVDALRQADGCSNILCKEAADPHGFDGAKQVAAESDAVVVLLGLAFDFYCAGGSDRDAESAASFDAASRLDDLVAASQDGTNNFCECEGRDRDAIELPSSQKQLVLDVRASLGKGKKLVAVLIHGGAVALDDETLGALDAVVDAFYPGPHGAQAIADVIFGEFSPSGRTPITFYRKTADLPKLDEMDWYPNVTRNSPGISYRYFRGDVLFPFGFGLSYTKFAYSGLKPASTTIGPCDTLTVTIDVVNTGRMDSDEVVQCYVKQPNASVPVPQVRLAAFARAHVEVGQTVTVSLSVPPQSHAAVLDAVTGDAIYTAGSDVVVEAGAFELYCGGGQPDFADDTLKTEIVVRGGSRLDAC
jgi:beta-glucosidase